MTTTGTAHAPCAAIEYVIGDKRIAVVATAVVKYSAPKSAAAIAACKHIAAAAAVASKVKPGGHAAVAASGRVAVKRAVGQGERAVCIIQNATALSRTTGTAIGTVGAAGASGETIEDG